MKEDYLTTPQSGLYIEKKKDIDRIINNYHCSMIKITVHIIVRVLLLQKHFVIEWYSNQK